MFETLIESKVQHLQFNNNYNLLGTTILPVEFHAEREGQYECHIHMASGYDVRTFVIESTVLAKERLAQIEFKTQAVQPLTQNIPVVSYAL